MKTLIHLIIILTLISCSKEQSAISVLSDTTIINFQANMLIIQEENRLMGNDSTALKYKIDSLYNYHQITEQQVEKTIQHLKSDINIWRDFNAKVVKRLELLQQEESVKKDK